MMRRSTWIVLGVFVVLAGFTFFFERYQTNKAGNSATATPTSVPNYLLNLGGATVEDIKIADNTGKSIYLFRDPVSSGWAILGYPADKVDSAKVDQISSQLSTLQVQDTLTETVPLEAIGMAPAAYTITLSTSSGSKVSMLVGTLTAIGSGYYVQNDAGKLAIVSKTGLEDIINLLNTPPLLPTATPEVTPTEIPTESGNPATPTP